MDVRALTEKDNDALLAMLLSIPPGEYLFVKRSLDDPAAVHAWLDETDGWWNGAFDGDELVGMVVVVPGAGWSSHVGEIRMVVAAEHRKHGVGAALARAALTTAVEHGCEVVRVEAVAEQRGVLKLFTSLGFNAEALLTDHVREPDGTLHDLVLMTHSVAGTGSTTETVGEDFD